MHGTDNGVLGMKMTFSRNTQSYTGQQKKGYKVSLLFYKTE